MIWGILYTFSAEQRDVQLRPMQAPPESVCGTASTESGIRDKLRLLSLSAAVYHLVYLFILDIGISWNFSSLMICYLHPIMGPC